MRFPLAAAALAAAFLFTGCATAPSSTAPAVVPAAPVAAQPVPDPPDTERATDALALEASYALLRQHRTAEALPRLEALLQRFESRYRDSPRRIYSSRGSTEALYYMVLAAGDRQDGTPATAMAIGPTWGEAQYLEGFVLVDLGRMQEAAVALDRAIALSPANSLYLSERGHVYQQAKDWPKALEIFTRAENFMGFTPPEQKTQLLTRALRGQGFALTEMHRLDESEARYRRCLELDPTDKTAANELAYIRKQRGAHAG